MSNGKSTILILQNVLFKNTDPNIITKISKDQTTITASNISEETFANLRIVTNNPMYSNLHFSLIDIQVYLDDNRFPTPIYGLYNIVLAKIGVSDVEAFVSDNKTHQPFINGFKDGITIGQLVDILSSLSNTTPDTVGKIKKYVLVFDPPLESSKEDDVWHGPKNPYPDEPNTDGPQY